MPIYDHVCDHCGHAFSVVQKFSDPPVDACPSCGRKPRRLVTAPAIVFKGSGWYKTDSRTSGAAAKDGAKSEAGSKDESGSTSGTASETKSESKSTASESKPPAPTT